jgi:hypothetical protein
VRTEAGFDGGYGAFKGEAGPEDIETYRLGHVDWCMRYCRLLGSTRLWRCVLEIMVVLSTVFAKWVPMLKW